MQFLGFWGRSPASQQPVSGWRAAVLVVVALLSVASFAGTADANPKFAAVTVDARNGKLLFAENADSIRHPASLTKMMTLYVLFQDLKSGKIKLNSPIRMSARAASMSPSKLGVKAGNTITVETAIKALVVKSANDVAAAVAENLGGTESAFAQRMTRTARSIGMSRSTFANASGLPNPKQVTTARDMATLGLRLMRDFPQYYPYFRTQNFTYAGRTIRGHNRLLGKYEGTDGIKTGYINASGFNLVTSVRRGDKRLVGVVLGGRSGATRDAYMKTMLSKHFGAAKTGKTIAAMAGSSKGAIDPVGGGTAADASDSKAKRKKAAPGRKKNADDQSASEAQVAQAPAVTAVPEQGDTGEEAEAQSALAEQAAAAAIAPAQQASSGSTFQQVEVETVPQPTPQPQVIESNLVDPSAPADLPFQVKTPSEQLADQATVASIASADAQWMINLGDYASKPDALAQLQLMRKKAGAVLDGKTAQTVVVDKKGTITYRARFTGFDENSAKAACKAIKKNKAACSVQAPA
ncbi:D-alanyl-D-alanine carboxypeptidase family protein [Aestuariivirga sp.]|uniref:D-alanyl-D-alanine carboxypeptidase family protein n=1 Tax=Aestuariivirga sp. TaxID=2650926 RepID=UPI0035940FC9